MAESPKEEKLAPTMTAGVVDPETPALSNVHSALGGSFQDPEVDPVNSFRAWFIVFSQACSYCALIITLSAAGFWATNIVETIGGAAIVLWLSQGLQVVNAVVAPPLSHLGDYYGRKWLVIFCIVFGVVGNIMIATASSMGVAIAGSCLFGIYFSSQGNTFAIASEVVPRRHRGLAQAFNGIGGNAGVVIGLIVGAALVQARPGPDGYPGWRIIFWIAASFALVVGVILLLFYRPPAPPKPNYEGFTFLQRLLAFDLVGCLLLGASVIPLLMGLIWGGATYPWSSGRVIALLVVGCVMGVVLALHQIFIQPHGLFDRNIFRNRNTAIALIGVGVEGLIYITYNQYYGEMSGILYEHRPMQLALRFATFPFASTFGALLAGWISYRYKVMKPQLVGGYAFFLIGTIGLATATPGSGDVAIFYCAIAGFGFGSPINLLVSVIQLAVEPEYIGLVTALSLTSRSIGGAIGTAIAGAVFNAKITKALPSYIADAALAAGLPASSLPQFVGGLATNNLTLAESAPGVTPAILEAGGQAYLDAFAHSFHFIWITIIPFIVVALVLMFFLRPVHDSMNALIDRPIEAVHHKYHVEEGTTAPVAETKETKSTDQTVEQA